MAEIFFSPIAPHKSRTLEKEADKAKDSGANTAPTDPHGKPEAIKPGFNVVEQGKLIPPGTHLVLPFQDGKTMLKEVRADQQHKKDVEIQRQQDVETAQKRADQRKAERKKAALDKAEKARTIRKEILEKWIRETKLNTMVQIKPVHHMPPLGAIEMNRTFPVPEAPIISVQT